ncbi:hypothetical protein LAC81_32500 [Ensifer adhaerens]|uniref:hypothetical protein n=1 Tax=Ensifer adhaerens TaxID=106592 RepID=UPI001CC05DB1|nr:hypothetical protein [Ensifer adhaerens]MBZ7925463.1 hypothetical protein [Ensifer adhaerens]UAX95377.1 hypothetical protein LAC78_31330 [Ensifer adhaerens]UAY02731.1 hypothetical protein LAC80_28980 [Ensifer adhaerens]UAY10715.1 hypothetical protein LAC81_32500 [Ensifer adhaerens]
MIDNLEVLADCRKPVLRIERDLLDRMIDKVIWFQKTLRLPPSLTRKNQVGLWRRERQMERRPSVSRPDGR